MNIEAFNTDTLRKLVRNLQDENKKLREKLDEANIPYEEINLFEQPIDKSAEYDPDQGGRIIHPGYITENMAKRFFAMRKAAAPRPARPAFGALRSGRWYKSPLLRRQPPAGRSRQPGPRRSDGRCTGCRPSSRQAAPAAARPARPASRSRSRR